MTRSPSGSSAVAQLRRRLRDRLLPAPLRYRLLLNGTPDVLFVWIPKTAGSSLYVWLNREIGMKRLKDPAQYRAFPGYGAVTFSHCHYLSLRAAGIVPDRFHARAFRFSVIRNPYLRAVSLYQYLCVHNVQFTGSFVQFLDDVHMKRPPVGLYNVHGLSQTNPQVDWLQDVDGRFVVDHLYHIDGLESLQADMAARFGPLRTDIPRRNTSPQSVSPTEMLTAHPEIVPLIEEIYVRDFALLGFSRDLSEIL